MPNRFLSSSESCHRLSIALRKRLNKARTNEFPAARSLIPMLERVFQRKLDVFPDSGRIIACVTPSMASLYLLKPGKRLRSMVEKAFALPSSRLRASSRWILTSVEIPPSFDVPRSLRLLVRAAAIATSAPIFCCLSVYLPVFSDSLANLLLERAVPKTHQLPYFFPADTL